MYLHYFISDFIELEIKAYKKVNNESPKGIIIYHQGVTLQQKEYLKTEIAYIDFNCQKNNIFIYKKFINNRIKNR